MIKLFHESINIFLQETDIWYSVVVFLTPLWEKLMKIYITMVGRDSVVGIATCYRLDVPGIKSRWGRDFQHPALRPTQPPVQWVLGQSQV